MTGADPRPVRTVVLLHEAPGGAHFDWLIAPSELPPEDPNERCLTAFRCAGPPHEAPSFSGARMREHRGVFLSYEGPLTGGRGTVRRAAEGLAWVIRLDAEVLEATLDFGDGPVTVRGGLDPTKARGAEPMWWFERVRAPE